MNILFLMKVYEVGGQEVVTATLGKCFSDHGHATTIVSFREPSPMMVRRTDKRIKFSTIDGLCCSKQNVSALKEILINNKIEIVINQWGLPYIPAKVLKKAKEGLSIKTIAIYHNSPDTNARIKNIEIALSQTHSLLKRLILQAKKKAYKEITSHSMRYVYNQSNIYQVLSPSFVDKFKAFTGIKDATKLMVQTNPVTIDSSSYTYTIAKKQKEIIYVGRIDYNQKRVCRVIDTWALLEEQYQDWKLTIVGDGTERNKIEKQVKDLGSKHISFEGFQQPEPYYERSSILILASEYEGFPLVLAECMAFGVVPVVYGSYSAVYDIIRHGENGMIVSPQNGKFVAKDMAAQLSFLMDNETKRDMMAKEAIITSKQDYSLETIYRSWENTFNKLVKTCK